MCCLLSEQNHTQKHNWALHVHSIWTPRHNVHSKVWTPKSMVRGCAMDDHPLLHAYFTSKKVQGRYTQTHVHWTPHSASNFLGQSRPTCRSNISLTHICPKILLRRRR